MSNPELNEAVILAGGLGTRLSEETGLRPKPMVEIGGTPIIVHIMNYLSRFKINKFVLCLGYKGDVIKSYFHSMMLTSGNVEFDIGNRIITYMDKCQQNWRIRLIETGKLDFTGSRLRQALDYVDDDNFLFTYGDGLTNQNITELYKSHLLSQKLATVTAVMPPGRFGAISIESSDTSISSRVSNFSEKPSGDNSWINAGYFILNKGIEEYLDASSSCIWEQKPLQCLAESNQLNAYKHNGFWKPMDTLKDKNELESMMTEGRAPWIT